MSGKLSAAGKSTWNARASSNRSARRDRNREAQGIPTTQPTAQPTDNFGNSALADRVRGVTQRTNEILANRGSSQRFDTINSQTVAPQPQVILPTKTPPKDQMGAVMGYNAALATNPANNATYDPNTGQLVTNPQTETAKDAFYNYVSEKIPQKKSVGDDRQIRQQQKIVAQNQALVKGYVANLNAITAKAQQDRLSFVGQGRGVPEAIIGGQQAEISRQAAIEAFPVQAQISAAQGDLELAQSALDSLYKLKSEEIDNEYQYQKDKFNAISGILDKNETRQYNEMQTNRDRAYQESRDNLSLINSWSLKYPENAVSFHKLNPKSPTFNQDLGRVIQNIGGGVDGKIINPEYTGVVDTILGSGKFTQAQKSTIRQSINNGEDPFTVIKNQAKDIMGQTAATKITNYEVARDTLSEIGNQLSEFYSKGGKTNIISGNFEKVINKLGEVNDPNLVSLATQLQGNIQVYRNAISGTAYSEQEGRDITSIFPGINKSENLNNAILRGRSLLFDSVIDSSYRSTLGPAYDRLKALEQSSQNTGTTPVISNGVDLNKFFSGNQTTQTTTTQTPVNNQTSQRTSYNPFPGMGGYRPFNLNSFFR